MKQKLFFKMLHFGGFFGIHLLVQKLLSPSSFQYIPAFQQHYSFHLMQDIYHEILLEIHSKSGNILPYNKSTVLKE